MLEDYFEGGEEQQQQQQQQPQVSAEVTITVANEIINPPAISVLLVAKKSAQCISAPYVRWAYAWFLVSRNITQK
jgi:hypothetical protein